MTKPQVCTYAGTTQRRSSNPHPKSMTLIFVLAAASPGAYAPIPPEVPLDSPSASSSSFPISLAVTGPSMEQLRAHECMFACAHHTEQPPHIPTNT